MYFSTMEDIMALYGIYGSHTSEACPIYRPANARVFASIAEVDPAQLDRKYRIRQIVGQYHSAVEHTFLWILEAEDPHLIEQFSVDTGLASFNTLKIVPLHTFPETIERLREAHGRE